MDSIRDSRTGRSTLFEGGIRASPTSEIDEFHSDTAEDLLQDSVKMLKKVGISGLECEGMHEDEFRHSIAPIINGKFVALSSTTPGDPTVSDQGADSIPYSEEWMSDSEYDESPEERDAKHPDYFVEEVYGIVQEALKADSVADVADKVNKLREAYGIPGYRIAGHLFYWMMKSVLETPHDVEEEFNNYIGEMVIKWKNPLRYFIDGRFDELDLIRQLEDICSSISIAFSPFHKVLTCLYKNDIVDKNTILYWAYDAEWEYGSDETAEWEYGSDETFVNQSQDGWEYGSDETFVNQSQDLIKMLKAPEFQQWLQMLKADPFGLVDPQFFCDSEEYYRATCSVIEEGHPAGEMDVMT